MLPFLRSSAFVATTVLSLLFSAASCSKDGGSTPTPKSTPTTPAAPGAVTASYTPASSITGVTATPASGPAITGSPAYISSFLLEVPVGTYTISFAVAPGYIAPANRTVTVTSGQQSSLGTITVPMRNSFSWTDGSFSYPPSYPPGGTFTLNSGGASASLRFAGTNLSGIDYTTLTISIPNANGPGTYTCNTTASALYTTNGNYTVTTDTYPGSGTVTITNFSLANRTAVGTFNFRTRNASTAQSRGPLVGTFNISF